MTEEVVVLTPTGCIGNRGIHRESFMRALSEAEPAVIAVDGGSLDPGPSYLGAGREHSPMRNVEWDLELLLREAIPRRLPVIIGSAGGSGARAHVDTTVALVQEIARRCGLHFRMAVIYADIAIDWLAERAAAADIKGVDHDDVLTPERVRSSSTVVAMMGVEPLIAALDEGVDIVIAGRASDAAVIGAYPIRAGLDPGLSLHLGDIIECGESAAVELEPVLKGIEHNRIPMIGRVRRDHVLIRPSHPALACTPESCSAHSLYERSSVLRTVLPGYVLDKSHSTFAQEDRWTTRIAGTRHTLTDPYTVLLEGVTHVGKRSVLVFGVRTPRLVEQLDEILARIRETELELYSDVPGLQIHFHKYGIDGVLRSFEFDHGTPREVGVVVDVIAPDQELAHGVGQDIRSRVSFWRYPGRQTTAGNVAVPFTPAVLDAGDVYELSIYHALPVTSGTELFKVEVHQL
jgi:hypothetical protein